MTNSGKERSAKVSSRYRELPKLGIFIRIILTVMPIVGIFFIMDIPSYLGWEIFRQQYFGLILAMTFSCIFLFIPLSHRAPKDRVPWYDFVLSIVGVTGGLYIAILYPQLAWDISLVTPTRVIIGTLTIIVVLEAARRTIGWAIVCVGLFSLLYLRFTSLAPGMLAMPGTTWDQGVNYLLIDTNGMLGIALHVGSIIVLAFVLFGTLLYNIGGGTFITTASMATFGRFRGGPAKIAVVASSLFGTVSGSAVANIMTVGVVTIPLMKSLGYKPHIAGAIEATASSGGQLAPPIMGAVAFVMADYLQIPYREVAIAAVIPALLYYLAIFFQVDMEAGKAGLKGLPREKLPSLSESFGKSYLLVLPFGALLYALFVKAMAPEKAALFGSLSVLILGFLIAPEKRYQINWISDAFYKTGRTMLDLIVICALIGIVIGCIAKSGAGFILSVYLDQLAGGNIFLLLIIVAVAALILGMGMPTLIVYLLLATMLGPGMIKLGIKPLAAHMFILYYACVSFITPPVCIAAYAAAAMADANPMRTAVTASRLGIIAYIVPFLFVFFPGLLLKGSFGEVFTATVTAIIGCFALSAALTGFLFVRLNPLKRVLFALAGLGLMIPIQEHLARLGLFSNVTGAGLLFLLLLGEWRKRKFHRSLG
jgi:TRAP transporter 4TM/12TM fusion protein